MNKNALKTFAVNARKDLIAAVKNRAYEYGIDATGFGERKATVINGRPLSSTEVEQRAKLVAKIQAAGFEHVMEEAAYTWFNRFIALRYMEVNRYLPSRIRVFTNEAGEFDPEILKRVDELDFIGEQEQQKVYDFIENSDRDGLFKFLIIAQCNALHTLLPCMFEPLSDYTELLFPANLLLENSVLADMVNTIPEEDWYDQVQIIGWLYQYYNSEFKDETYAELKKKAKLTKEKIPAVTQLFTPDWIVRYMVENSLGRLWYEGHPDEAMKSEWKYFLDEAEQEAEVQKQLDAIKADYATIKPEEIKIIDPSMGSGHVLVYAFDVLMQIYRSQGWNERDAAKSIVENNLYGIDIDKRAYQLAYFAVMMKARSYSRRILTQDVKCNLCAIEESNELNYEYLTLFGDLKATATAVADEMRDAKEYGSILIIKTPLEDLLKLQAALEVIKNTAYDNFFDSVKQSGVITDFKPLLKQAIALAQKYDVVVTNPPYMGSSNMTTMLNDYVKDYFPYSKSDMSTVFMEKCLQFSSDIGYISMINIPVWMFLSSYEELRKSIIEHNTLINMVHPGRGIFGSDFGTVAFTISKSHIVNYKGVYRRLFDRQGEVETNEVRESAFLSGKGRFYALQDKFSQIPGAPIAYWVSNDFIRIFIEGKRLGDLADSKQGIATADNNRFLRQWFEVEFSKINYDAKNHDDAKNSNAVWYPYNKGGEFRKWYGNNEFVVNWHNDGAELRAFKKSVIRNPNYYFRECFSWSLISSSVAAFRYKPHGHIFDVAGMSCFSNKSLLYLLGLCNTNIVMELLKVIAPTINYQCGDIANIPVLFDEERIEIIEELVKKSIDISRTDWDSFETSWDFKRHPLVSINNDLWDATGIGATMHYYYGENPPRPNSRLELCYLLWQGQCNERFRQLKANEEELNRIFIDIYGLQDELTPEVEDKDVTVRKADLQREIKSLISYAVGCMFGRYIVDKEGLQYAGGSWSEFFATCNSQLATTMIDSNNIIPITDEEYFNDDIVSYFVNFVRLVYGEDTLEENLKFIADALGGTGTPREIIRKYFLTYFYKDHLKTYQKRPIYWLFDSGKKNGFKALIYMHRYTPDLLARMRTDYVHELQEKYRMQIANYETDLQSATGAQRGNINRQLKKLGEQLHEINLYEEIVHHMADQMIAIDLDDGVKVNYAKFGDLLAKIK